MSQNLVEFKAFIQELAASSGQLIQKYFLNKDISVERKGDASPVTVADRGAEELMREMIIQKFPDHGILGEEFDDHNIDAEYVWVLDPIDGTISFSNGSPLFVTLIGLLKNKKPILGAIHQPILGQLVVGDNESCEFNGVPCHVREHTHLSNSVLLTTDVQNITKYQPQTNFTPLQEAVEVNRTWGDGYGYLLVATGWADIMVDPILNPWDILPIIPVIRGAGGIITDWHGNDPDAADSAIAANPRLHAQVLSLLEKSAD